VWRAALRLSVLSAMLLSPSPSWAQWGVWAADSLLAEGRLASAESAYYAAARQRPRDPATRAALGRFIAARGGTKAGAVLLEEARFFGGDSAMLARALVPMYVRLGDYKALAELRPNVLSPSEARRARWLATRPQEARLRDSVVVFTYRPTADGRGMGTVILRFGKSELPAMIDPRISGIVVPAAARRDVRIFGTEGDKVIGVIDSVRLGPATFFHVPAVVGTPDEPARVGFDVIAPYYPGFDPAKSLMTLRRVARRAPSPAGLRVPGLFDQNGMRLLIGGRWVATTGAGPSMLLSTRPWLWDWRLGDVVLVSRDSAARP
jgi:hypothetical protein